MGRLLTLLGGTGVIVGGLCCFTALLPTVLTAIGAGGLIPALYRDAVLLPFVAASFGVMMVGLFHVRRQRG